jgi:hypothetical protein
VRRSLSVAALQAFEDIGPYPESEIPDEYKSHWAFMQKSLA